MKKTKKGSFFMKHRVMLQPWKTF